MRSVYPLLVLLWSLSFAFAVPFRLPWRKPRPSMSYSLSVPYEGSAPYAPYAPGILLYLSNTPYDSTTPANPSKSNSPKSVGSPGENSRRNAKNIHGAAVKRAPPLAPATPAEPLGRTPLRNAGDIYNVAVEGYEYQVFTPDYKSGEEPVAKFEFPTEAGRTDQIIITHAHNGKELPHDDGTPRLHLSDMIEDVADYHAHKSLSSINKVVVESVINDPTLEAVSRCYAEWRAAQADKKAKYCPLKVTVNPSNKTWTYFKKTPFVKAANFAFKGSGKTVKSVDIISEPDVNLVLNMGSLCRV